MFWKPKPQKHGFDFTKLNENEIEKLKNYAIFKDYEFKSDDILYELVEFYKEYEQRDIEDLLYDEQHAEFVNSFISEKDEQWYKELEELL
ncbi:hypothetical protein [Mycoplasma sp. HU2014]|uniref:hypothetical protein n=1 Tax=Mycoplasma sp. HU2014 TaxID=1664275 RepID=UPI00067DF608|nr:hypothetical protein [Mycoplasma sp. HU2014]KNG79529.1 hypothetical protein AB668_01545 [Mycoplasma sp. HU2014]